MTAISSSTQMCEDNRRDRVSMVSWPSIDCRSIEMTFVFYSMQLGFQIVHGEIFSLCLCVHTGTLFLFFQSGNCSYIGVYIARYMAVYHRIFEPHNHFP